MKSHVKPKIQNFYPELTLLAAILLTWLTIEPIQNIEMPAWALFVPGAVLIPLGFYCAFLARGKARKIGFVFNVLAILIFTYFLILQIQLWTHPLQFNSSNSIF
jgi:hypothetical protein